METATAEAVLPGADSDLRRVALRALALLSEGPREGMPAWGYRGIAEGIRGADKGLLLAALWALQEQGLVTATATTYQGRSGLRWRLEDPLSLYETAPDRHSATA